MSASTTVPSRSVKWVFIACWAAVFFDGYDLFVYGSIVPPLLADKAWNLTPVQVGLIGSVTLVGMLIGALVIGTITDLVGARGVILIGQILFSLAMIAAALAPTPEFLGAMRFLAGLGLGGMLPSVSALAAEYSRPARRTFSYAAMYSGLTVGGVVAALLAVVLVPAFGWRGSLLVGGIGLVTVVPLCIAFLPESVAFLRKKARFSEADRVVSRFGLQSRVPELSDQTKAVRPPLWSSLATLFRDGRASMTIMLWVATFCGLLLLYGIVTWLPQLMRQSGYDLGPALLFAVVLNLGGVVGALVGARIGDRVGAKKVVMVSFAAAAVATLLFLVHAPLPVNLLLAVVTGFGSLGTATLINALILNSYPTTSRATALGWALGVGRIGAIVGPTFGGFLVASGLPVDANFYAFAATAVLGLVAVAFVRAPKVASIGTTPATAAEPAARA